MAIKENMDLYRCEKCKKLYTSEYAANICCKQYHCRVCGKETPQYMLICDSCAEHERFEKAKWTRQYLLGHRRILKKGRL